MCKAYPERRCHGHALTKMQSTLRQLDKAKERYNAALSRSQKVLNNPSASPAEVMRVRSAVESCAYDVEVQTDAFEKARIEYYATDKGYTELTKKIEVSESAIDKIKLEKFAAKIKAMRDFQDSAGDLRKTSEKEWSKATDDEKEQAKELDAELEQRDRVVGEAKAMLDKQMDVVRQAREEVNATTAESKDNLQVARTVAYKNASEVIFNAYKDQGIPDEFARHYADDSVNSANTSYAYYGPNSIEDRMPLYSDVTIKVKSEGHEHAEATRRAAEALQSDPAYKEVIDTANRVNNQYTASVHAMVAAHRSLRDAVKEKEVVQQVYSKALQNHKDAKAKRDVYIANISSGMKDVQTYDVDPKTFVSSAYRQSDGSTNAYVLFGSGRKVPYYARVKDVVKNPPQGSYMVLENGVKIYAVSLQSHALRLVKPDENSQKLF